MKIFVRTLKGARFEIQVNPEDSVADVKKNVETMLGGSAYPAAEQVLIHKGKVLKDETTVEANNVSEKSIIGVMKQRKAPSTGTSTSSASLESQVLATPPSSTPPCVAILCPTRANWSSYTRSRSATETPRLSTGSDLNYDSDSEADLERAFDFARYTEEYEYIRAMAESDPSNAKDYVEILEEDNSPLLQFIRDNKPDFLRLLREGGTVGNEMEQPHHELKADQTNEPNNGGGDGGNVVGESKETEVDVTTSEDDELIERLEALGFERGDAAVAYFACNKNVQDAANHLLGHKHESRRE